MAKQTRGPGAKKVNPAATRNHLQKGTQQGHNTGKDAWKSNLEFEKTEPGTGQKGQRPRKGELFGTTPGEPRGNPGGKKGQAMGGQRGSAKSRKAKPKARAGSKKRA